MNASKTFVVGIDTSAEAAGALEWTRAIAEPDDRITLLNVWGIPLVTGYETVIMFDPSEIEQSSKARLDDMIDGNGDGRLVAHTAQGHAGRQLVSVADEAQASAIVVGHNGSGRISMMLGSTTNYVLHHTRRPVVVIRGDHVAPPKLVVVGVDDHDVDDEHDNESVRALRWAFQLRGIEEVRVVHAWFLPALAVGMFAEVSTDLAEMDAAAKTVIDRVMSAAGPPPAGVKVSTEPTRGTPGFALIEASRDADLIVLGSRGRGGFKGLLLGSTSAEVAAHSHAPVAVIR
jgi:nucleotide-binding universal stress UspA family protein